MYFLLPRYSVILKHTFLNSRYFCSSKLLPNALPSRSDKWCWGPDPCEHLVEQVSLFLMPTLSQHTEQPSPACAAWGMCPGPMPSRKWCFSLFCSTQNPCWSLCRGRFHHIWTTASQCLQAACCVWYLKFKIQQLSEMTSPDTHPFLPKGKQKPNFFSQNVENLSPRKQKTAPLHVPAGIAGQHCVTAWCSNVTCESMRSRVGGDSTECPPTNHTGQNLPPVNSTQYRQQGPSPPRLNTILKYYHKSVLFIKVLSVRLISLLIQVNKKSLLIPTFWSIFCFSKVHYTTTNTLSLLWLHPTHWAKKTFPKQPHIIPHAV